MTHVLGSADASTQDCNILILGATGNFGRRISERLAASTRATLVLASRSLQRSAALVNEITTRHASSVLHAAEIDQFSDSLVSDLQRLEPDIVVHTAGPYQALDYRVAEACIAIGSHYVDLADGRAFVSRIDSLNSKAVAADVLIVSGASTLPGLSGAVLKEYQGEYEQIDSIEICIAPAHQTPRGLGTVEAVLGYCGKRYDAYEGGEWKKRYGWQNLKLFRHPVLGLRLAADCDVPDLVLYPLEFKEIQTVTFQASLEAWWEHLALYVMAWFSRIGLVNSWQDYASFLRSVSGKLLFLGSDVGGMSIRISGTGKLKERLRLNWILTAYENHGPEIPCIPAVIIVKKLLKGELSHSGAVTCNGLVSLSEFQEEVADLRMSWQVQRDD